MEPEIEPPAPAPTSLETTPLAPATVPPEQPEDPYRGLKWIFIGPEGLRSGWSVLIFLALLIGFMIALSTLFARLHLVSRGGFAPKNAMFSELFQVIALVAAAAVVAAVRGTRRLAERRRVEVGDDGVRAAHRDLAVLA